MSKHHPTPIHLLRRGSPSNVSVFPLVTHKGGAVAGLGMGIGSALRFDPTATAVGVWSRPFIHLASPPTSSSAGPPPTIVALARNRTPAAPSTTFRPAAAAAAAATPLSRVQVSQHEERYVVGYNQHRTGVSLDPATIPSSPTPPSPPPPPNPFISLIRGPFDPRRPPVTKGKRRVWNLGASDSRSVRGGGGGGGGWDQFVSRRDRQDQRDPLTTPPPMPPPLGRVTEAASFPSVPAAAAAAPSRSHRSTSSNQPSSLATQTLTAASSPTTSAISSSNNEPTKANTSPSSPIPPTQPQQARYILQTSASGIPKQRHQTPSPRAPHPADPLTNTTAVQVGEDAYYIRPESLGISDGVGGWSSARRKRQRRVIKFDEGEEGGRTESWVEAEGDADPGRFSRLLMHFCEREVEAWRSGAPATAGGNDGRETVGERQDTMTAENGHVESTSGSTPNGAQSKPSSPNGRPLDPVEVMQKGYEKCLECVQIEGIFGSATCLVAVLTDNQLRIANLGDCAIVVVRSGEIVFRTEEMQHSFNFPLQLGTNSRDEPMKDAEYFEVQVEKGDIIVMCSDGLSDNLFDEDILDVIASSPSPQPNALADALCRAAQEASEETGSASPFMCRAIEEGLDFMGGKKDDISVLVAVVRQHDEGEGEGEV